jgi:hypothetical protein
MLLLLAAFASAFAAVHLVPVHLDSCCTTEAG